ncbi:MAG TPA: ribonuclease III [Bacteroidales bacterium]|nr:ribonuclease III [Bacteroidales bacterium]
MLKSLIRANRYLFPPEKSFVRQLKRILGFRPRNLKLYQLAFVHKSASHIVFNDAKLNNERLEFLGDAILDALVGEYLFRRFPDKEEGFLTQTRSKLVNRDNLNHLAIKLGISEMIISKLSRDNHKSVYGDTLEALIGALYLDKGYVKTKEIVLERIIQSDININRLLSTETDFKSRVIEWGQKNKKAISFTSFEETEEQSNSPLFITHLFVVDDVVGRGSGSSKKEAEQNAARQALQLLE